MTKLLLSEDRMKEQPLWARKLKNTYRGKGVSKWKVARAAALYEPDTENYSPFALLPSKNEEPLKEIPEILQTMRLLDATLQEVSKIAEKNLWSDYKHAAFIIDVFPLLTSLLNASARADMRSGYLSDCVDSIFGNETAAIFDRLDSEETQKLVDRTNELYIRMGANDAKAPFLKTKADYKCRTCAIQLCFIHSNITNPCFANMLTHLLISKVVKRSKAYILFTAKNEYGILSEVLTFGSKNMDIPKLDDMLTVAIKNDSRAALGIVSSLYATGRFNSQSYIVAVSKILHRDSDNIKTITSDPREPHNTLARAICKGYLINHLGWDKSLPENYFDAAMDDDMIVEAFFAEHAAIIKKVGKVKINV